MEEKKKKRRRREEGRKRRRRRRRRRRKKYVYISRPTRCTNSYNVSFCIIKRSTCFGLFSPSSGTTFWSCISQCGIIRYVWLLCTTARHAGLYHIAIRCTVHTTSRRMNLQLLLQLLPPLLKLRCGKETNRCI